MLLTRQQVIALSGLSDEDIAQCERAGLISAARGDGDAEPGYRYTELTKLHIVRQVAEASGGVEEVVRSARAGAFDLSLLQMFLPETGEMEGRTLTEVLKGTPVTVDEVQAMLRAAGLPDAPPDVPLRVDTVEVLEHVIALCALPLPEEARLHSVRTTSEAVRRAAETQVQIFRQHIEEPLLGYCQEANAEARATIASIAEHTVPAIVAMTNWLHRSHLEHAVLEAVTSDMMEAVRGGAQVRTGDPVVVFVDLVGFTPLTDGAGDHRAAQVAATFEDVVIDSCRARGGRIVKMLGDGALLLFTDCQAAVRASLEIVGATHRAGLPRVRIGVHRGPVVSHAGDVFGLTVNVAARINEYARPREVLVSAEVAPDGIPGVELEEIGEVSLKGVPRPVSLLRAREHRGATVDA